MFRFLVLFDAIVVRDNTRIGITLLTLFFDVNIFAFCLVLGTWRGETEISVFFFFSCLQSKVHFWFESVPMILDLLFSVYHCLHLNKAQFSVFFVHSQIYTLIPAVHLSLVCKNIALMTYQLFCTCTENTGIQIHV